MSKISTDKKTIDEILTRSVAEIIGVDKLKQKLIMNPSGVVIKYGIDPTKPDLHLGHVVCLKKLREFQNLGCKIVLLIGDFTAQIGDPTGKDKTRPPLSGEQINENVSSFIAQIPKILITKQEDIKHTNIGDFEIVYNFDWYRSIHDEIVEKIEDKTKSFINSYQSLITARNEILKGIKIKETTIILKIVNITTLNLFRTLSQITLGNIIERKTFRDRLDQEKEIHMNELLYPVLQGLDSFVIGKIFGSCDLEIGGTDQLTNMKMGQKVQRTANDKEKQEPQTVMTIRLLEGLDGKEKMSKSLNNYIGVTEDSNSMFGKIMSLPDTSILNYFELCTDVSVEEIKQIEKEMKKGANPRDFKIKLAKEIVKIYHDEKSADEAEQNFINQFQKNQIPEDIAEFKTNKKSQNIIDLLVDTKLVTSKSNARQMIDQKAVKVDGELITSIEQEIELQNGTILQKGKRGFVKIIKA